METRPLQTEHTALLPWNWRPPSDGALGAITLRPQAREGVWPLPPSHLFRPPLPEAQDRRGTAPIVSPIIKGYYELRLLLNQGGNPTRTPAA